MVVSGGSRQVGRRVYDAMGYFYPAERKSETFIF